MAFTLGNPLNDRVRPLLEGRQRVGMWIEVHAADYLEAEPPYAQGLMEYLGDLLEENASTSLFGTLGLRPQTLVVVWPPALTLRAGFPASPDPLVSVFQAHLRGYGARAYWDIRLVDADRGPELLPVPVTRLSGWLDPQLQRVPRGTGTRLLKGGYDPRPLLQAAQVASGTLACIAIALVAAYLEGYRPRALVVPPDTFAEARLANLRLPAGLCSPANPGFVSRLRDELSQGQGGGTELQSVACGLQDQSLDQPGTRLAAALANTCYQTAGMPRDWAGTLQNTADVDEVMRRDPDVPVMLAQLQAECEKRRMETEEWLTGRIVATYVGRADNPEAATLREQAIQVGSAGLDPRLKGCFMAGAHATAAPRSYADLCRIQEPHPKIWEVLSGISTEPVTRSYRKTRFSGIPKVPLWNCDLRLDRGTPAASVAASWGVPMVEPRRYGDEGLGSQLQLEALLMATETGKDPGSCGSVVARRLGTWQRAHPLVAAIKAGTTGVQDHQLCAQVCAAAWSLKPLAPEKLWLTPNADLSLCTAPIAPNDAALPSDSLTTGLGILSYGRFEPLRLPWHGNSRARPPSASAGGWVAPSVSQICSFHVVAQGYLSTGAQDWPPGGPTAWAGVDHSDGEPGVAAAAALAFASEGLNHRWGAEECGAVAAACYAELAMVVRRPTRPGANWKADFSSKIQEIAAMSSEDVESSHPWCALIHPYVGRGNRNAALDSTCRSGVDGARTAMERAIDRVMRGGEE